MIKNTDSYNVKFWIQDSKTKFWYQESKRYYTSSKSDHDKVKNQWQKEYSKFNVKLISIVYE
jgi:hypothetical protein